ncbi:MAG: branched-chain amino acid ABC transporter ATP-binding protein/permease [Thermodesulfobacteriota bacterium]|jgi:branched-chain amino acid transport system permease protein
MRSMDSSAILSLLRTRWQLLIFMVIVAVFPISIKTYFLTRLGIIVAIYAINVAGLTLVSGYAGIISLGHAAFFACGAYLSAILTVKTGMNPWLAIVIATMVSGIFAYLFSIPFLRLRRAYLAMATLGLGEVIFLLAKDLTKITGGVMGIPDIPYLRIGELVIREDWQIFYLVGFFCVFVIFLTENLGKTRLGRAYHAIRTNETAAEAMGINVQRELSKVFSYSAALSGLSGSLLAHFLSFISPDIFTLHFSFTLLLFVIMGGANVWGGLIVAILLTGFSEFFRGLQDFSMGLYGLLLIITLFLFPEGLAVLFRPRYGSTRMSTKFTEFQRLCINVENSVSPGSNAEVIRPKESSILEFNNVSKNFGGTIALEQVSGFVKYGQILGVIGPNGAGKTTLLNVINGFLAPRIGKIIFEDQDVTAKSPHQMAQLGVGRTFQISNLFKGMTVLDNVMVGGHTKARSGLIMSGLNIGRSRLEEKTIAEKTIRSLDFLGLANRAYEVIENLSYGEQKLVEIARALTMEPRLLLLDEPSSGLTPAETKTLANILGRIREQRISMILIEHNMPLIMNVSDLILVLNFGRRIALGTPNEVSKNDEVIKAYLGKEY